MITYIVNREWAKKNSEKHPQCLFFRVFSPNCYFGAIRNIYSFTITQWGARESGYQTYFERVENLHSTAAAKLVSTQQFSFPINMAIKNLMCKRKSNTRKGRKTCRKCSSSAFFIDRQSLSFDWTENNVAEMFALCCHTCKPSRLTRLFEHKVQTKHVMKL